ncbi:MAG TPA: hypothetical protein VGG23_04760, partial [Acidimicrobiales bacterium]
PVTDDEPVTDEHDTDGDPVPSHDPDHGVDEHAGRPEGIDEYEEPAAEEVEDHLAGPTDAPEYPDDPGTDSYFAEPDDGAEVAATAGVSAQLFGDYPGTDDRVDTAVIPRITDDEPAEVATPADSATDATDTPAAEFDGTDTTDTSAAELAADDAQDERPGEATEHIPVYRDDEQSPEAAEDQPVEPATATPVVATPPRADMDDDQPGGRTARIAAYRDDDVPPAAGLTSVDSGGRRGRGGAEAAVVAGAAVAGVAGVAAAARRRPGAPRRDGRPERTGQQTRGPRRSDGAVAARGTGPGGPGPDGRPPAGRPRERSREAAGRAEAGPQATPKARPGGKGRPAVDPTAARAAQKRTEAAAAADRKPLLLVVGLVVVALLGGGAAYYFQGKASDASLDYPTNNQALIDQAATAQVVSSVTQAIEAAYTYDSATLDADENRALGHLTGGYVDEFKSNFDQVRQQGPTAGLALQSKVAAIGVENLSDDSASLLVMLNQVGHRGGASAPLTASIRLSVMAEKVDGQWKVSEVDVK